jgi:glycerophosphoryl diester phosphodiesterase
LAHRGGAARAPENTLGALAGCADRGFAVELDVCLSADGVPIVIHDDTLDRTTAGRGPVGAQTAAALQALPAAVGWGPAWAHERVPTLRGVLAAIAGRVWVDIELKSPPGRGPRAPLVDAVLAVLDDAGCTGSVFISSFDPFVLGAVADRRPEIYRGLLVGTGVGAGLRLHERLALRNLALVGTARPDVLIVEDVLIDRARAGRWRQAGYGLLAWTVNAPVRARALIEHGVQGVITDDPDLVRAAIGPAPAGNPEDERAH